MSPPQLRGKVIISVITIRRARLRRGAPAEGRARGRAGRGAVPGRRRVTRRGRVSSRWPTASVQAAAAAAATAPPGQRRAPAPGGSGQSEPRPSPGTLSRLAPPGPSPARQHQAPTGADQRGRDALSGPRPASRSGPEHDTCRRYSGYSEDTTADNVSSPKPKTCRGYSEDTQNGAGDNGGSACGYQTGFALLASLVRVQRTTSPFMFMQRRAWHEGPLCTRSVSCGWRRAIGLLRAPPLGAGSACQAAEARRRLPAAVRAPHGELPWRDAEDSG